MHIDHSAAIKVNLIKEQPLYQDLSCIVSGNSSGDDENTSSMSNNNYTTSSDIYLVNNIDIGYVFFLHQKKIVYQRKAIEYHTGIGA